MQLQLDTRTLIIVAVFVALLPSLVGALVWQNRRSYPGRWVLGNLLAALCLLFLSLRGTVPDWISIVLANASALGAGITFLQGIRAFRGLRLYWWPECLLALLATAAVTYFRYATANLSARILVMSLALGSIGLACGITLLKEAPDARKFSMVFTANVFILGGGAHILRGIYIYAHPPLAGLFDPSGANAGLFLGASLAVIGWSFGFILMTAEPLGASSDRLRTVIGNGSQTAMIEETVSEAEVRAQLQKIIESDVFRKSARMERFLTLAVDRALMGRPEDLKEYALGRDVFNRGENYDPRADSIVRVEAQRLRRKLREYYERYGSNDAVMVEFRPGNYVPVFRYRVPMENLGEQYSDLQPRSRIAGS